MSRDSREPETIMESIEALHATGHEDLAEELENLYRQDIHTYNRILGYLKKSLYTVIFVGGTLLTIGGFGWMAIQGDAWSSLVFLALGLCLLTVTGLMVALFNAVEEHFEANFHEKRIETMSMIDRIENANSTTEREGIREAYDR